MKRPFSTHLGRRDLFMARLAMPQIDLVFMKILIKVFGLFLRRGLA